VNLTLTRARSLVLLAGGAVLLIGSMLTAVPADAGTAYMLERVTFQPYGKSIVAGPFYTLTACMSAESSAGYQPGGTYECDMINT
jgi:hypothetical protein